jgi:hypothetical protein
MYSGMGLFLLRVPAVLLCAGSGALRVCLEGIGGRDWRGRGPVVIRLVPIVASLLVKL